MLGLGMMIDNSIIVIDNITQYRERGAALVPACVTGTNEVFTPMLSSMLTSCAVFFPLMFLSGIAGALFYDQAVAVATGHFVSLLVSVTLIPVYYRIVYGKDNDRRTKRWAKRINGLQYEALYEKTFRWVMRHQPAIWMAVAGLLIAALAVYSGLPKSKLPPLTRDETLMAVDWNERINVEENRRRTKVLVSTLRQHIGQNMCMIGEQQYLLNVNTDVGANESVLYLKAKSPRDLRLLEKNARVFFASQYPEAVVTFREADNLFNLIFPEDEPYLIARLRPTEDISSRQNDILRKTMTDIQQKMPGQSLDKIAWQESMVLRTDPKKMMMYDIPFESLYNKLTMAFNKNDVFVIKDNQDFVPVVLGGRPKLISDVLSETYVPNRKGILYPVRELVSQGHGYEPKIITAGQEGEYFPLNLKAKKGEAEGLMERLSIKLKDNPFFELDFSGSFFSNKVIIRDLSVILLVSLALLYFILASQFESLLLPLIVLIEVPIDIAGSLLFLKIFGLGINLMSLIGIVVMSGIIINDSILKVDTVNQLIADGYSLMRALFVAGQRRLKSILMTSIITVLAMSPLFFSSGLGAELQKPLALALAAGMLVGTPVSLYVIPLCYYYLKRNTVER